MLAAGRMRMVEVEEAMPVSVSAERMVAPGSRPKNPIAEADGTASGAEGFPGGGGAGAEVIAVFGEDAGGSADTEERVKGGVGSLGEREEGVFIACPGVQGEGAAGTPGVFEEACPLLSAEGGGGLAEGLGEAAEAEEVRRGEDGWAAFVGEDGGVEGEVGDEVHEPAGVAFGDAAVVAEGAGGVGLGGDAVVDEGDIATKLDEMMAASEGEGVGQLDAALVGIGELRERGGGAEEEAVGGDIDLGGEAARRDGRLLREGRLRSFVLEIVQEGDGGLVEDVRVQGGGGADDHGIERAGGVADAGAATRDDGRVDEASGGVPADAVILGGEGEMGAGSPIDATEVEGLVGAAGGWAGE